jgi:hypothetical protein
MRPFFAPGPVLNEATGGRLPSTGGVGEGPGPGVPPVPSLTVTVAAHRAVWSAAVTVNEAV